MKGCVSLSLESEIELDDNNCCRSAVDESFERYSESTRYILSPHAMNSMEPEID